MNQIHQLVKNPNFSTLALTREWKGATVKLVDSKTSQERTTTTNDRGVYLFAQVPPGQGYILKFSATGFESLDLSGIALGVGNTETHNAQLTAGQVSANVVVTAEAGATLNADQKTIFLIRV